MKRLAVEYNKKKHKIKNRLKDFDRLHDASDEDIFSELCFCILTPQTRAVRCNKAVGDLKNCGLLFKGGKYSVSKKLKGLVRFHNKKAGYIVAARRIFKKGRGLDIKSKLAACPTLKTRDWFVKNIKGLGYKEASHFLRNIGLGKDIAIIDRHILKNLKSYGIIKYIPSSIGKKRYLEIEEEIRRFSERVNIPMEELDLLFWSGQTGFIFK